LRRTQADDLKTFHARLHALGEAHELLQYGRPVGLQIVGHHRGEAELLQAAALFEQAMGLDRSVPLNPRLGAVPRDQSSSSEQPASV
jgi:hypothetical protein